MLGVTYIIIKPFCRGNSYFIMPLVRWKHLCSPCNVTIEWQNFSPVVTVAEIMPPPGDWLMRAHLHDGRAMFAAATAPRALFASLAQQEASGLHAKSVIYANSFITNLPFCDRRARSTWYTAHQNSVNWINTEIVLRPLYIMCTSIRYFQRALIAIYFYTQFNGVL